MSVMEAAFGNFVWDQRNEDHQEAARATGMSVVMSVCDSDRESELREAVESLLAQTYSDFEIVVVAHGVGPDLWKCLEEFHATNPIIRIISVSERLPYGGALNMAIHHSRGKYIVHTDPDDISRPDRLARLEEFFRANPDVDIVGSFIEEFNSDGEILGVIEYPLRHDAIRKRLLRRNPVAHASTAVRADQLDKIGMYVRYSIRNEDTLLWLNALKAGARFANVPEPLYRVRYARANNRRRTGFKKAVSDLVDRVRIIIDLDGSWRDVLHAIALCVVQNCPGPVYQAIRSSVVYGRPR